MDFFNAIRGRKKRPDEISTNKPLPISFGFFGYNFSRKNYADGYLWVIFNKIFKGLANVRFSYENRLELQELSVFCENHIAELWWQYLNCGYMIIAKNDDGYRVPDATEVKKDNHREVMQPDGEIWSVTYSQPYQFLNKTDFQLIRENLENIDTFASADAYLTSTYGCLGILSSKNTPMNVNDKDEITERIKETKGITKDKNQFILSSVPLDFSQINFDLNGLNLSEKINRELVLIADYFGVPLDMVAVSGHSTYANQEQAQKSFYQNTISPIAEAVLATEKNMVRRSVIQASSDWLSFTIDNVGDLPNEQDAILSRLSWAADILQKTDDPELTAKIKEIIEQL